MNVVDPELVRRCQDLAILFTGAVTGHRHAEFSRLTLGDVRSTLTGFTWTLAGNQHKGGILAIRAGAPAVSMTRAVDHLEGCPSFCPACILGRHLEVRRRLGATPQDALFGGAKPLGITGTSAAVRRLWSLAPQDLSGNADGQRVSSRSLRATAATLAREQGMSIPEISEEVTGHRQYSTTALYIRRLGGRQDKNLVLSLKDPTHVSRAAPLT